MNRLPDVSFVIPAKIDSPERCRNLDVLIDFLLKNFDSPVTVLEADVKRRYFPATASKQLKYLFVEDHQKGFNHTRYLNRLYKTVITPMIGIMDTDVIAPPDQIIATAEQIRQGKAVLGLTHDGSVFFISSELADEFKQTMNMETLENAKLQLRKMNGRIAVGGVVLVDRNKYLQAGGENEFFSDWGPEDLERVKRIEILYRKPVFRYPGYVFHLWHPRNNSQYNDPQKEIMFKQEYLKVCGMNRKELKFHIDGWTWNNFKL